MKIFKNLILLSSTILISVSMLLTSCDQENNLIEENALNKELEIAVTQSKIDDVSEGIDDIIDNVSIDFTVENLNKTGASKTLDKNSFLSDCVIITKVINDLGKNITLDFGEGCTTKNDNIISGKIIIEVSYNFEEKAIDLVYSFDNFYFNDKKIEGEVRKSKLRINENGFPEVTINRDIKIIWEDDSFVTVKGERKREWIEGIRNGNWADNVFLITGSWTITKKDGTVRIAAIIDPLKRNMACRFLVSGIVEIQKNNKEIILNYGDGTCDNIATATIDGVAHEIPLKKRRG